MLSHRPPALDTRGTDLRVARLLSIAAHPLALSPLTVALATRNWRTTALVAASTFVPLLAVILWKVRSGSWSDFDVSRRDQRSRLYVVAIPIFVAAAFLVPGPPWFQGTMLSIVGALTVALALTPLLKTSLHMLFGAFCAVVLARVYPWSPAIMVPLLLAVAWSRWRLHQHTEPELIVGTVLGLAAGVAAVMFAH